MLNSIITTPVTLPCLLICLICSLILGVLTALVFSWRKGMTSSFALTLALLPVAMCMVAMMINGNLGVAVAVAGSFTLVRFRSIAGTGREIVAVFVDMTLGVIIGMGYVGIAVIFFVLVALIVFVLGAARFGENAQEKLLRITIPEDYDYEGLFEDIFAKYGVKAQIWRIKTTNMGSLIDVTYRIRMNGGVKKQMLDELRTRNANLGIMVSACEAEHDML